MAEQMQPWYARQVCDKKEQEMRALLFFEGKYYPKNLYDEIVLPTIATRNIEMDIQTAPHNLKRVQIVDAELFTANLEAKLKPVRIALQKDDDVGEILIDWGDKKAAEADIEGSMRCYNLALLVAHYHGQHTSDIYKRRSAMFLTLKDHKSCLKDTEISIVSDVWRNLFSPPSPPKGFHKKLIKMCSRPEDKRAPGYKDRMERKLYRDDVLFSIDGPPNPKIPVASECVQVKYDKHKGRHLVATADLAPGTTIIVENPYVKVLKDTLLWDIDHCGWCFKKTYCLEPCKCLFVMFCNEDCRGKALKNGHNYECVCLVELHGLRTDWLMHLSFRTICKAGPIELHVNYLESKKNKLFLCPGDMKGFNPDTGIYEEDSYYQITKLVAHSEPIKKVLPSLTVMSVILAHLLDYNTDFFKAEPKGSKRNAFIRFVASRLLFHATSFSVNSFGLLEKRGETQYPANLQIVNSNAGAADSVQNLSNAVYPFISLIPHSCFANSVCHHLNDGRMAIVTNRSIKCEEEINITYGYVYWEHELALRKSMLNLSHHFTCYCIACCTRWPKTKSFYEKSSFLCPHCSGEFNYSLIAMIKHCVLIPSEDGKSGLCKNCKSQVNLVNVGIQIEKYEKKFSQARRFFKAKKPLEAIPILVDCIQFFQKSICPPSTRMLDAMKLLDMAQGNVYRDLE